MDQNKKVYPLQVTLGLGTFKFAQERWEAYLKAAEEAKAHSLAAWMRSILDAASGIKKDGA